MSYFIIYLNDGPITIEGLTVTDTLPACLDYIDSSGSLTGDLISWDIGDLSPGQSGTLTLKASIRDDCAEPFIANSVRADFSSAVDHLPAPASSTENRLMLFVSDELSLSQNVLDISGNAYVEISWKIMPSSTGAKLVIYNSAGELVRNLYHNHSGGSFSMDSVRWYGKNDKGEKVASGLYIAYLQGTNAYYKKIIVVR